MSHTKVTLELHQHQRECQRRRGEGGGTKSDYRKEHRVGCHGYPSRRSYILPVQMSRGGEEEEEDEKGITDALSSI